MTAARDVMTPNCECVGERESLAEAAQKMRDLDVGALPIWGEDDRLKGMLTDRDIVIGGVAQNANPSQMTAGSLANGTPISVETDADVDSVLETMTRHQIRRLPVVEDQRLAGMIAQADMARVMPVQRAGRVVEQVSVPASA